MNKKILKICGILLGGLYPFVIYFLLKNNSSFHVISIILVILACINFSKIRSYIIFIFTLILAFVAYYTDNKIFLKIYPVIMNLGVASCFLGSLSKKPLVTLFAEKMGHSITKEVIDYTKKATIYWGIFMLLNAVASLITVFMSDFIWVFYNGFISYILIGLMFLVEFLIRSRIKGKHKNV